MNTLDQPIGQLARQIPGATAVFHALQLDFCCGGKHTLREAAQLKQLDANAIAQSLEALANKQDDITSWSQQPNDALIDHIISRYHDVHRKQLPELIRLAERVEAVHVQNQQCPVGLAEHLAEMLSIIAPHMQKEEQALFPMIKRGMLDTARGPASMMRHEHNDHGAALTRIREITNDLFLPPGACNTWRALYLGLLELEKDLMDHIHLENNVLFERLSTPEVGATR